MGHVEIPELQADPETGRVPLCSLPDALLARLEKAEGHINAVRRKLWYETERGLWSGDQAKARLAEIWLWLQGKPVEPLPLGHYLKKDALRQCLQSWSQADLPETLQSALDELAMAERAIHEQPFPTDWSSPFSDEQNQALNDGIVREGRYEDALCRLKLAVEEVLAPRYLDLHPGDWSSLPDSKRGKVLWLQGLSAYFFVGSIAISDPGRAVQGYYCPRANLERTSPPASPPITAPGYYWLKHARDALEQTRCFIEQADLLGLNNIGQMLLETLDAAAKAWWITFQPINNGVIWANQSTHHILQLLSKAPSQVAEPLNDCLCHHHEFVQACARALPRQLTGWEPAMNATLERLEQGLAGLEALLAPVVDLAAGDWIAIPPEDKRGHIVETARSGSDSRSGGPWHY